MKDKHFNGTLDVSGTGRVSVAPDEATISLTVITEGNTAAEAVAANAQETQAVIEAISAQPHHGVTTSGLGVSPILEYDASSRARIVGYRATNCVIVKTKVAYAGQIFDTGVNAGAHVSSGISFGLSNESQYREDALRLAVRCAYCEARSVAKAADIELEGPESISIEPGGGNLVHRTVALDRSSPATPVIPQDVMISATVRMVFRTKV